MEISGDRKKCSSYLRIIKIELQDVLVNLFFYQILG